MSRVVTSIDIAAPPDRVWEVVMDPRRFEDWVSIHRELHATDDGPPRSGMRVEQTLSVRGAKFRVKWVLTECEEGRYAVWEGKGPVGAHARTVYELKDLDGQTRFDYSNEFRPPGGPLGAAASRVLVGGVPEREANRSLARLKALVEN